VNLQITTKTYTGEAFAKALGEETLQQSIVRVGMIKSDADDPKTLLFTESGCTEWIKVPLELIEEVAHLSKAKCSDHEHPLVAIRFKEPSDPAGRLFADLARSTPAGVAGIDGMADEQLPPDTVFRQHDGGVGGTDSDTIGGYRCLAYEWFYFIAYIRDANGTHLPVIRRVKLCKVFI
jgi:hypothetical protein